MRAPRLRYLILFAVCSFIVAVTLATFMTEFSKIHVLGDTLDSKMSELEKLERKNQNLKRELANARTASGIEREARDKYNMLKPGEKMYKIEVEKKKK